MVVAIDEAARAQRVWLLIQRDPESVVFTKPRVVAANGAVTPESNLAAQTVRVSSDSRPRVVAGMAGDSPQRPAIVYGVRDHPDPSIADSDIAVGYTFRLNNDDHRVVDLITVPGGVQAVCVVNARG